jgi:hypothetical protein
MSHGLYREDYLQALYMVYKYATSLLACAKRFPKAFTNYTIIHKDGYPEYRR